MVEINLMIYAILFCKFELLENICKTAFNLDVFCKQISKDY